MNKTMLILGLPILLFLCAIPAASQEVYTYYDEDGTLHFTDMPKAGATSFIITTKKISGSNGMVVSRTLPANVPYRDLIRTTAMRYGLDPMLVSAVARVESDYNPEAVSKAGAKGMMQLMDGTATSYGVKNVFDAAENLDAGTRHLRDLLKVYDGNLTLALAAYNAGRGAVKRHGGVPPYKETVNYLRKISNLYGDLAERITVVEIEGAYLVARAFSQGRDYIYRSSDGRQVIYIDEPPPGAKFLKIPLRN